MQTILNLIGALVKIIFQAVAAVTVLAVMLVGFTMYAKAQEESEQVRMLQIQYPGINEIQAELLVDGTWNTCLQNPLSGNWECSYNSDVMDGDTVMLSLRGISQFTLNR
jgi:hypothetical protein